MLASSSPSHPFHLPLAKILQLQETMLSTQTIKLFEDLTESWVILAGVKGIFEKLPSEGEPYATLHDLEPWQIDRSVLVRLLGLLVSCGMVHYDAKTQSYANTTMSAQYSQSHDLGKAYLLSMRVLDRCVAEVSNLSSSDGPGLSQPPSQLQEVLNLPLTHCCDTRLDPIIFAFTVRICQHFGLFDSLRSPDGGAYLKIHQISQTEDVERQPWERAINLLVQENFVESDGRGGWRNSPLSLRYRTQSALPVEAKADGLFFRLHFDDNFALGLPWINAWDPQGHRLDEPNEAVNPFTQQLRGTRGLAAFHELALHHPAANAEYQEKLRAVQQFYEPVLRDLTDVVVRSRDHPERLTIVDMGGGDGSCLTEMLRRWPSLAPRAVLQDINPEGAARNVDLPDSVEVEMADFFDVQTRPKALLYHWRLCAHDFGDDERVKAVLDRTSEAMALDSILLVSENVLAETPREGEKGFHLDCAMLCYGGKERSHSDFGRLLARAGLKLTDIHVSQHGPFATLEARKVYHAIAGTAVSTE